MSKLRRFLLPSLAGIALAALAVLGCIAFSDMVVAPPPLEGEVPSAASILADPKVCPSLPLAYPSLPHPPYLSVSIINAHSLCAFRAAMVLQMRLNPRPLSDLILFAVLDTLP